VSGFETCWVLVGVVLGWIGIDLVCVKWAKQTPPVEYNIGCAFVGAVVAYTLFHHYVK
jgi:hypothetical protein